MNRLPPTILHKLINEPSVQQEVIRLERDLSDANITVGRFEKRLLSQDFTNLDRTARLDMARIRENLRIARDNKRLIEEDLLRLRKQGSLGLVSRDINDMINEGQSSVKINQRFRKRKTVRSKRRRTNQRRRSGRRTRSRRRTRRGQLRK